MSVIQVAKYRGNLNEATVVSNVIAALKNRVQHDGKPIHDTVVCVTVDEIFVIGTEEGVSVAAASTVKFVNSSWAMASADMDVDLNSLRKAQLRQTVAKLRKVWSVLKLLPVQILHTLRHSDPA